MLSKKWIGSLLLAAAVSGICSNKAQAFYGFRCYSSCGICADYSCDWNCHRRPVLSAVGATARLTGHVVHGAWHLAHVSARVATAPVRGLAHRWHCGCDACCRGWHRHRGCRFDGCCDDDSCGCSGGCDGDFGGDYGVPVYSNELPEGIILEETPLDAPPEPTEAEPPTDAAARAFTNGRVRFARFERVAAPSFADGSHAFRAGDLGQA
ncbi:MAG: hypothetical protein KDA42_14560 [Planctomycetales bacterium]|nr:hypothetical protein [Planctomycetales bacterium]